jgi:hypothetical protein
MKVVDDFFSHPDYHGDANKISEYAKYATHRNGPIAWGVPSPMGATDPKSKNFVVCPS